MPRTRTTKKLAQRIDLNYFQRPTAFRRARFWLSLVLPLLAAVWLIGLGVTRDNRVFSSGHMAAAHAVLESQCAACHIQRAGEFSAQAADSACLACHDGPIHHANQTLTPSCATCHAEHRGRIRLTATNDQACRQCHADLTSRAAITVAGHISSFESGHPEFAALRDGARDPGSIKLNHAMHMKPIRRGPNGPIIQLDCADCHRPAAVQAAWAYSDARFLKASAPSATQSGLLPLNASLPAPDRPPTGRERMAPVRFATACASCHLLDFDKLFQEPVPHDKPEVIHAFLLEKYRTYIAAHPVEARVVRDPSRDLTGKPMAPQVRVLTPAQWVIERSAAAEELLWRKTCKQCHSLTWASNNALPEIAAAKMTAVWMPKAKFDHDAHRGFSCLSCHAAASSSTETSDVLIPGIATCRKCHAPGPQHAESRCFECHTYHDWSQRKEVTPHFTLPSLQPSGQ